MTDFLLGVLLVVQALGWVALVLGVILFVRTIPR